MNEIVSRNELLEGYYKFESIEELFDSDILILPKIKQEEGTFHDQLSVFDIKEEFPDIKVKYYYKSQNSTPWFFTNQVPQAIELGYYVISTLAGMVTIGDYLIKHYKSKIININLYIKFEKNKFLSVPYKGKASDIDKKINEVLIENKINSYDPAFKNSGLDDPDKIRKYKQLFDDGIITQEEFEAKKKEILGI